MYAMFECFTFTWLQGTQLEFLSDLWPHIGPYCELSKQTDRIAYYVLQSRPGQWPGPGENGCDINMHPIELKLFVGVANMNLFCFLYIFSEMHCLTSQSSQVHNSEFIWVWFVWDWQISAQVMWSENADLPPSHFEWKSLWVQVISAQIIVSLSNFGPNSISVQIIFNPSNFETN